MKTENKVSDMHIPSRAAFMLPLESHNATLIFLLASMIQSQSTRLIRTECQAGSIICPSPKISVTLVVLCEAVGVCSKGN